MPASCWSSVARRATRHQERTQVLRFLWVVDGEHCPFCKAEGPGTKVRSWRGVYLHRGQRRVRRRWEEEHG